MQWLNATRGELHRRKVAARRIGLGAMLCGVLSCWSTRYDVRGADEPFVADRQAEELFAHRVLPLMKDKCWACHGDDPQEIRGEFDMRSRAALLRGGESGEAAIVPGKPEASPLYLAVRWEGLEMPPKENDRLSNEQIEDVRRWIAGGAPWPDEQRLAELVRTTADKWHAAEGVSVPTSGGLKDEWTHRKYQPENLWAYRPLWQDADGRLSRAERNPIDVLIDKRLAELQFEPSPLADRRTLIRRVSFDLLGLPPTPAEIEAFVNDPSPDEEAFDKLIERLLASPHYGEQYARHWLDVVRYADSSGFANDYERGSAWRYRDYVIRAFNDDKPYDQFIREQIAGDELYARGGESDPELLVAAGFLRMGPWELTGMEVAKIARQRFLDDVTDAVGQVFLGHMLQCARCHDHKFDPVPTRDYYSIQAAFATTQLAERQAAFLPKENTAGFDERRYLEQRQRHYQQVLSELKAKQTVAAARDWYADNQADATAFEAIVSELEDRHPNQAVDIQQVRRLMAERKIDPALIPPRHVGFTPRDFGLERIARKGLERLAWRLDRYEPVALSVYSGRTPSMKSVYAPLRMPNQPLADGTLEETCILAGGDPFSPQQPVAPGVLSVVRLTSFDHTSAAAITEPSKTEPSTAEPSTTEPAPIVGRREALADWIASTENPLTARVMVNRIWQWHFGQPLAGNPNNFGATGKKPTHPELLDYLATKFIDSGWSVKQLHRLVLRSEAYRRSTQHPEPQKLADQDPLGTSYAAFRPRRLDAEELRDAMLLVSGELNPTLGGIPVRPEMNLEAALQPRQVMGTFAEAWQPSPLPEQRHRRSIYALRLRGQRDPFQEVFNAPSPDLSCEAREASTVTPQVFAMFNSEISFERALAFAHRLQQSGGSREQIVDRMFQQAYGRAARPAELAACLEHWTKMTARHERLKFDLPVYPREVVREAVEENTGEKFTFAEPLEVYADFVPDLKPANADAALRGLAEVGLVVLNSNEFVYVY